MPRKVGGFAELKNINPASTLAAAKMDLERRMESAHSKSVRRVESFFR